ncbi:MAG: LCP family protein [Acutalibacter sp.]|nr:LCP family protein [Acutalibacter sp.]
MARKRREDEQEFEDLSSYSSTSGYSKQSRPRKGQDVPKIIGIVVCVLLLLIGGIMIYIATDLLEGLTTTSITKDPEKLGISPTAIIDESITNIALFGVDSRKVDFTGYSDVIMVLTVDNKHRKLKMTSILRDSKVPIEGETLNGDYMNWDTKINAAYAYGGPELAIRTLNQNYGLDIENYVTINFANMAAIVDAFGGVDVELTAEEVREINRNLWRLSQEVLDQIEKDKEEGTYERQQYPVIRREDYIFDEDVGLDIEGGPYTDGVYHLNGNRAVAYGRIRDLGNDYARVGRQQTVFRLLIDRLLDMGVVDYLTLIKEMMPYCETSLDLGGVMGLTPILTGGFSVESIKVPDLAYETDLYDGKAEDEIYYLIYDVAPAAQRISSFIYEEASPYWETYGNTAGSSAGE